MRSPRSCGCSSTSTHPDVGDVQRAAGLGGRRAAADFGGNFNLYVKTSDLIKQEGIIFRHLLRLILLCGEFAQLTPPDTTPEEWQAFLRDLANRLTASCRRVDPTSTDEMIQLAHAADVVGQGPVVDVVPSTLGDIQTPAAEAPAEVKKSSAAGVVDRDSANRQFLEVLLPMRYYFQSL